MQEEHNIGPRTMKVHEDVAATSSRREGVEDAAEEVMGDV